MKEFLKLIRWQNLLIVILTMVLMRYFVISPLLSLLTVHLSQAPDVPLHLSLKMPLADFILLVVATVCITAAGYVINDYFDIKADLINRGKIIVGTRISRRKAIMLHSVFNIVGVGAGFYVSARAGSFWLGMLFLIVSGLLYFYSASYKRQFLIGNLIVAVLVAMVPLLVVFYEWPYLYSHYSINSVNAPRLSIVLFWVGGFALFAFLSTLTREIIKDIEDFEGDKTYGRNTVPVVMGIPASRILALILLAITVIGLYLVWFFFVNDWFTFSYLTVAVVAPLLMTAIRMISGRDKQRIHSASNFMKLAMLTGILYSLVVRAIITWNLVK